MRKGLLIGIALGATLLPQGALAATAAKMPRPTSYQARWATLHSLETYAEALDGKVVVAPCAPKGGSSRVCFARVTGPVAQRFRVVVTTVNNDPTGRLFMIRARPAPLHAAK